VAADRLVGANFYRFFPGNGRLKPSLRSFLNENVLFHTLGEENETKILEIQFN
jgi:hypothetical protein